MGKQRAGVKLAFLAIALARDGSLQDCGTVYRAASKRHARTHTGKYQHNLTKNTSIYPPKSLGPWAGWMIKSCS